MNMLGTTSIHMFNKRHACLRVIFTLITFICDVAYVDIFSAKSLENSLLNQTKNTEYGQ